MAYTIVVHEDGQPFVRHERVRRREELKNLLARTHNAMLDTGYALFNQSENGNQRALTYRWVKSVDPLQKNVHVVVLDE